MYISAIIFMFVGLVILLVNNPTQAVSEPRVSTMTCTDLSGNINVYTGTPNSFTYHDGYSQAKINVGTHYLYYPQHMCIYKEAK